MLVDSKVFDFSPQRACWFHDALYFPTETFSTNRLYVLCWLYLSDTLNVCVCVIRLFFGEGAIHMHPFITTGSKLKLTCLQFVESSPNIVRVTASSQVFPLMIDETGALFSALRHINDWVAVSLFLYRRCFVHATVGGNKIQIDTLALSIFFGMLGYFCAEVQVLTRFSVRSERAAKIGSQIAFWPKNTETYAREPYLTQSLRRFRICNRIVRANRNRGLRARTSNLHRNLRFSIPTEPDRIGRYSNSTWNFDPEHPSLGQDRSPCPSYRDILILVTKFIYVFMGNVFFSIGHINIQIAFILRKPVGRMGFDHALSKMMTLCIKYDNLPFLRGSRSQIYACQAENRGGAHCPACMWWRTLLNWPYTNTYEILILEFAKRVESSAVSVNVSHGNWTRMGIRKGCVSHSVFRFSKRTNSIQGYMLSIVKFPNLVSVFVNNVRACLLFANNKGLQLSQNMCFCAKLFQ